MKKLPRQEDPTGFLNLFRMAAADRFGDPSGNINGRGRWHHLKKKGPGRVHGTGVPKRENLKLSAVTRNPFTVERKVSPIYVNGYRDFVHLGPVRMKLPRLRRCAV